MTWYRRTYRVVYSILAHLRLIGHLDNLNSPLTGNDISIWNALSYWSITVKLTSILNTIQHHTSAAGLQYHTDELMGYLTYISLSVLLISFQVFNAHRRCGFKSKSSNMNVEYKRKAWHTLVVTITIRVNLQTTSTDSLCGTRLQHWGRTHVLGGINHEMCTECSFTWQSREKSMTEIDFSICFHYCLKDFWSND